jgi:hypothetical protein
LAKSRPPGHCLVTTHAAGNLRPVLIVGKAYQTRNETFNVTNGDVFVWENVWPAIAEPVGMCSGGPTPFALDRRGRLGFDPHTAQSAGPPLHEFVGRSLKYADYRMRFGRTDLGRPALVSTV